MELPFHDGCLSTVLSHGALHLFADAEAACREWRRVLAPGGSLRVSSLTLASRRGDRWLRMLHRAGEIAEPRTPQAVAAALEAGAGRTPARSTQGCFAYLSLDAPGA